MEMIPFIFGKLAETRNFTNRKAEIKRLVTNFSSGINTILISPRRWGKSSLILKAAETAASKDKKLKFCFIDLYNVRTEDEFYLVLSTQVIRATANKLQESTALLKKFLTRFIPRLSVSADDDKSFSLSFDMKEVRKNPEEILDLAEKIATEKGIRVVICIDEFQNVSQFDDPVAFQKKLRSFWQKHKHVSYCLYGSRRHMMIEVFSSQSMPFYKFGDLIFMEKIHVKDWVTYIITRFRDTGKSIEKEEARMIAELVECHSYYVQQLAQQCWLRSGKKCSEKIVIEAHESLMLQMSMLFQSMTDQLSKTQVNFLEAVLENEHRFNSQEVISEYKLGTSSNVIKVKQTLLSREIIDIQDKKVDMIDPLYKAWLKKYYFRIRS